MDLRSQLYGDERNALDVARAIDNAVDTVAPIFQSQGWQWWVPETDGLAVPDRRLIRAAIERLLSHCIDAIDRGEREYATETGRLRVALYDGGVVMDIHLDVGGTCFWLEEEGEYDE